MVPGVYRDIPFEDYREGPGVSVSTLKIIADEGGPARVKCGAKKETKSLAFGSLIHTAILEPTEVEKRYFPVSIRLDSRTKKYQTAELDAAGREIVSQSDYDDAWRIRDAVLKHAVARDLITDKLETEVCAYALDPETGLLRRGRADGVRADIGVMFDLKSARAAGWDGFSKAVDDYAYHWQDPYYRDIWTAVAWEPNAFIFLVVEPDAPFLTAAYEIIPEDIEEGREEFRKALRRYAECVRTDEWPGLPDTLQEISRPAWRRRRSEQFAA